MNYSRDIGMKRRKAAAERGRVFITTCSENPFEKGDVVHVGGTSGAMPHKWLVVDTFGTQLEVRPIARWEIWLRGAWRSLGIIARWLWVRL